MTVREMVFSYTTEGAASAKRADEGVRRSVRQTGKVANQQAGQVERWMERNRTAIRSIGLAAAGAMAGILSLSPRLRAELSAVRVGFTLFSDTLVNDVLPGTGTLNTHIVDLARSYRELDDSLREPLSILITFGTIALLIARFVGVVAGALSIAVGVFFALSEAVSPVVGLFGALGVLVAALLVVVGAVPAAILAIVGTLVILVGWLIRNREAIAEFISNGLNRLVSALSSLGSFIFNWAANALGGLIAWFGDLKDRSIAFMAELYDGVTSWLSDLLSRGVALARDIVTGIADWFSDLVSRAFGFGRDVINRFVRGIRSAASSLVSALSNVGRNAADAFKSAFNAVIPSSLSIPRVSISIPSILGGGSRSIGGGSINLPQLRTGGKIDRSGLAMVHRGERVMPAAQVSERGRQPNGTVVNMEFRQGAIVVQGGSGTQRAARDIVEEVSNEFETRLGGRGVT